MRRLAGMSVLATAVRPCLGLVKLGIRPSLIFPRRVMSSRCSVPASAVETYALPKEQFRNTLQLVAIKVPAASTHVAVTALKADVLDRQRTRRVIKDPADAASRLVLLSEHVRWIPEMDANDTPYDSKTPQIQGLAAESAHALDEYRDVWSLQRYPLELGWKDCSVSDVLRELLPEGVLVPVGFEVAGHVAHLNLREKQLPHKHLIGAVVLDKNYPRVRSVVNKVGSIVSKFRTFDLEVLAGDSNLDVELIESGITFKFTYGAVYWNSKLQHEHARVLELLQPGDFVVDLFAGVGPFAVPAAKHRGCTVVANDLNPRSAEALEAAAWGCDLPVAKLTETRIESSAPPSSPMRKKLRRRRSGEKSRKGRLEGAVDPSSSRSTRPKLQEVSESCAKLAPFLPTTSSVTVGNLDAAACVAACAALAFDGDSASGRSGPRAPDHVLMNLPAMAVSFLHALAPWRPLISSPEASETREGTSSSGVRQVAATHSTRVHCYTFSTAEDPGPDAVAQVERGLGDIMPGELDAIGCLAYVHLVRSTAPGKTMVCVGFDLPPIKPKN